MHIHDMKLYCIRKIATSTSSDAKCTLRMRSAILCCKQNTAQSLLHLKLGDAAISITHVTEGFCDVAVMTRMVTQAMHEYMNRCVTTAASSRGVETFEVKHRTCAC